METDTPTEAPETVPCEAPGCRNQAPIDAYGGQCDDCLEDADEDRRSWSRSL